MRAEVSDCYYKERLNTKSLQFFNMVFMYLNVSIIKKIKIINHERFSTHLLVVVKSAQATTKRVPQIFRRSEEI